jgi:hypothetical protein
MRNAALSCRVLLFYAVSCRVLPCRAALLCACSDAHASVLVPLMLRAFDSNSTRAQEETLKALQVGMISRHSIAMLGTGAWPGAC